MNLLKQALHRLGVDGAIAYSSAARIFQAFSGVASIFFIATFLSGIEQGYYYTFGSILGIQVFFELGFTGIMTQYVAHEFAYLEIDEDFNLKGPGKYLSRLAYLLHFCVKWYTVISVLFFILVTIAGFIYFGKYGNSDGIVSWKIPWIILTLSTAFKLFQAPFNSFLQGLGYVKEMNKISFYQQFIIPVSTWIALMCSFKLYVVGFSSFLGVAIWFIYVFNSNLRKLLVELWKYKVTETISYMKEIFPYQWKIALSWVSGYFIFQLFNPVLFATEGAEVAGQMGMTLQVLNAIHSFALSWQSTKVPKYSVLIELHRYKELDLIFNRTLKQMILVCISLLAAMFMFIWLLRLTHLSFKGQEFGARFLDYLPMLAMAIPIICNQFIGSWAAYLRCHKKEPFLINSIVMGILCCLSTTLLGSKFGVYGVTLGYCVLIVLISFPWCYLIFRTKKYEWHK